ncbi:hypothetical protein GCM10008955_26410 [Deinococcus malanensis]|uniref:Uncharacterized protein n=1 Tax=Deinococcus malanensis TaxID=1706855 RepID=A0ABQ2EXW2_9DEIO|nr:hypothetical protein GCM10008955_26410 [Deinococcus malanensis]
MEWHGLTATREEIDRALNYPSVAGLISPDGTFEDVELIAENAARYLPRVIRPRLAMDVPLPVPRPSMQLMDSRHGMSYALALLLQEDQGRTALVDECRQRYWEDRTAPFPWLTPAYESRRQQATQDALRWLEEQERREASGRLMLQVLIETDDVAGMLDAVNISEFSSSRRKHSLTNALQDLILKLDALGGTVQSVEGIPHITMTWEGWTLTLQGHNIRVSKEGPMLALYQACQALSHYPGWTTESALRYVLTDEPPALIPRNDPIPNLGSKSLSADHVALLQLKYMTPGATWPYRLRIWDFWLRTYPEEGFTLTFKHKDRAVITTDTQRAKWLNSETKRAIRRAVGAAERYLEQRLASA